MASRNLLTAAERTQALAVPTEEEDLAAHHTLSEADMSLIRQRREDATGWALPSSCVCCGTRESRWPKTTGRGDLP